MLCFVYIVLFIAAALQDIDESEFRLVQVASQQRHWLQSRNKAAQDKMSGAVALKTSAVIEVYPRMRECYDFFAQKICLVKGNYFMAVMVYLRLLVMCVQASSPAGGPCRVESQKGKGKRAGRKHKIDKNSAKLKSTTGTQRIGYATKPHKGTAQNTRPDVYNALFSVANPEVQVSADTPVRSGDVVRFVRQWNPLKVDSGHDDKKLTTAMALLIASNDFIATLRVMKERFETLRVTAFPPPDRHGQQHPPRTRKTSRSKGADESDVATWPGLPYITMLMGDTFVQLVATLLQLNQISQNAHAAQLLDTVVQTAFGATSGHRGSKDESIIWASRHPRKHLVPSRRSRRRFWAECTACLRSVAKARLSTVLHEVRNQRRSHPYLSRALVVGANVYMAQKDPALAMQLFQQALSIQQQHQQHLRVGLEEDQAETDAEYHDAQAGVRATGIGLAELYFRQSAATWRDCVKICIPKLKKRQSKTTGERKKSAKKLKPAVSDKKKSEGTAKATDNPSNAIESTDSTKQQQQDDSTEGSLLNRVKALLHSHEAGLSRYKLLLQALSAIRLQLAFRRSLVDQIQADVVRLGPGPPLPVKGGGELGNKPGIQGYLQVYVLRLRPPATTGGDALKDDSLPDGWEKRFDESSQSFHFYNASQDKSVTKLSDIVTVSEERDDSVSETTHKAATATVESPTVGRWMWRWCTLLEDGTFSHCFSCWTADHGKHHHRMQLDVCAVEEDAPLPGGVSDAAGDRCVRVLNASKQVSLCIRNPGSSHLTEWANALRKSRSGAVPAWEESANEEVDSTVSSTADIATDFPCMPSAWMKVYTPLTDSIDAASAPKDPSDSDDNHSIAKNEWAALDSILNVSQGPYIVLAPVNREMFQHQTKARNLLLHALEWYEAPERKRDGDALSARARQTHSLLGDVSVLDSMSLGTSQSQKHTAKEAIEKRAPRIQIIRLVALPEAPRDRSRELLVEALGHYTRAFVLGQQHDAHCQARPNGSTPGRYWIHSVECAMEVIRPLTGVLRVRHLLLAHR